MRLHYEILGEQGPWLALVSGGRRSGAEFLPLARRIAALGFRVVLHDRRNTGASDVIIDGTDNFPARYLNNDAAFFAQRPIVYGSVFKFEGQVSVFDSTRGGPCYRCLFPKPPPPGAVPSCAEAGVFGVLPAVVGSLMAAEALKVLLGIGKPLAGHLLLYDALEAGFRKLTVRRNPRCPVCGDEPTQRELVDYEAFCGLG